MDSSDVKESPRVVHLLCAEIVKLDLLVVVSCNNGIFSPHLDLQAKDFVGFGMVFKLWLLDQNLEYTFSSWGKVDDIQEVMADQVSVGIVEVGALKLLFVENGIQGGRVVALLALLLEDTSFLLLH